MFSHTRRRRRFALLGAVMWFAGFGPTAARADGPETPGVYRDVAYGEAPRQRLDLFVAPGALDGAREDTGSETSGGGGSPVVLYFHGGGFVRGDKSKLSEKQIGEFHARGLSVAAVNYRFADTDLLPAAMHDGARAVQFLRHHAERFGLDPDAVAVTGSSAGAGISLWIAFHDDLADPDAADAVARESSRVSAAWVRDAQIAYDEAFWDSIGLAGVITAKKRRDLFGEPADSSAEAVDARERASSPLTHLTADDPPVRMDFKAPLDLDGSTTPTARLHHPNHGVALVEACEGVGVACELYYPGGPVPAESAIDFLATRLAE